MSWLIGKPIRVASAELVGAKTESPRQGSVYKSLGDISKSSTMNE